MMTHQAVLRLFIIVIFTTVSCSSVGIRSNSAKKEAIHFKTVFIAMRGLDSTSDFYWKLAARMKKEFEARGIAVGMRIFDLPGTDTTIINSSIIQEQKPDAILMISQYTMKKGFYSGTGNSYSWTPPPLVFDLKIYRSTDEVIWRAVLSSPSSDIDEQSILSSNRIVDTLIADGILTYH